MTNDRPAAELTSDDPGPTKKTEVRRSAGGGSSGLPPSFRIGTGLDDWKNPFTAADGHSRRRHDAGDLFGIDFGDETTRIAEPYGGNPILVLPKGVATRVTYAAQGRSWEAQEWGSEINMLRTRLRLHKEAEVHRRVIHADQLVIEFFRRIHEILEAISGATRPRVVLTVPSNYSSEERKELIRTVEAAEFSVLGLINDYAAPVLSFLRRGPSREGQILVVTLGSTSLSAAILNAKYGSVHTKSAFSSADFAGEQLMRDLVSFLQNKVGYEPGETLSEELIERTKDIRVAVEALQSIAATGEYSIQANASEITTIQRSEFIEFLRTRLSCVEHLIKSVIKSSETNLDSIDYVLFNGRLAGSELIRSVLASFVPGRKVIILNPDRASCFGAALHASVLAGIQEIPSLTDILAAELIE